MKSLFGKYETYTTQGSDLFTEAMKVNEKLFAKWMVDGYSVRDISHIIHDAVSAEETFRVLKTAIKERKKESDGR